MKASNATALLKASFLIFVIFPSVSLAQLGEQERDRVQKEIADALHRYHTSFTTMSPAELANQIYGNPLIAVNGVGVTNVWSTNEEVAKWAEGFRNSLKEQDWHHSAMPEPNICVLTENSGFASGEFVRYREDGTEISRTGMAYIFQRKSEGWRMTTFLAHDNDVTIEC